MIVEKAQVVSTGNGYALVNTERRSGCSRCAVNKGCGTSVLSKVIGRRYAQIRVANRCNARVGDTVTIGMSEAGLLKSALVVYAVPLLGVVLVVSLGTAITGGTLSEGAGIALGAAGFALGVGFARRFSLARADNPDYHPVILSVEGIDRKRTPPSGDQGLLAP